MQKKRTQQEHTFVVDDAIKDYLPLMHEIVIRTDLIAHICNGKMNIQPQYAREFVYLQLRYICELIAIGTLKLHGYLGITNNEWNAESIIKKLIANYEHAFPQSAIIENGNITCNSKQNALTIKEFKELYSECGDILHKGKASSTKAAFLDNNHDYDKINTWQSKIIDLLNQHFIGMSDGKGFYIVSLKVETGYPRCSLFTPNSDKTLNVKNFDMEINYI